MVTWVIKAKRSEDAGAGRLAAVVEDHVLNLLLAAAEAALADAHPPGHVPLRDDADGEAEELLDPLGDPFAGVDAAVVDDVLDVVGQARPGLRLLLPLVDGAGGQGRGRVEPADPARGDALADGGVLDLVDGVEDVEREADELLGAVLLLDGRVLLFLLRGGAASEERLVIVLADGLHGEEDVRGADGVGLAQDLGGPELGLVQAAVGREILAGVAVRAGAAELGALDQAFDDAQLAGRVDLPPPRSVPPSRTAVARSSGMALVAALHDQKVTALDLGHDTSENLVDKRVERRVADKVMGDVDEEALVGANRGRKGVKDVGKRRHCSRTELVTCRRVSERHTGQLHD